METGHHESTEQILPQSETWLRNPERPPTPKGSAQSPVPPPPPAACGSRSLLRGLIFGGPGALDSGPLLWLPALPPRTPGGYAGEERPACSRRSKALSELTVHPGLGRELEAFLFFLFRGFVLLFVSCEFPLSVNLLFLAFCLLVFFFPLWS